MVTGNFYYLKDSYYNKFPNCNLIGNKSDDGDEKHDRPCFYAFKDPNHDIYWMIPFSSQVNKYRGYYNQKMQKYHRCDTIAFGDVLGHQKAFLIQNMCPITDEYVKNEYIDSRANIPVRIDGAFEKDLIAKAKKVLALQRKGHKLIFPNVLDIESKLIAKLNPQQDA